MIEITDRPISPEQVIGRAKTKGSGCVATYVGLIRDNSHGKQVASVEYRDIDGKAVERLNAIAADAKKKWHLENVAFTHRVGKLNVGDINLVAPVDAGISVAASGFLTSAKIFGRKQDTFLATERYISEGYAEAARRLHIETLMFVNDLDIKQG